MRSFSLLAALQTAAPPSLDAAAGPAERFPTSPLAWAIAGGLLLLAAYLLIRLLEWDAMNSQTPDQDDPLL